MKVRLMLPDEAFDVRQALPAGADALSSDLDLDAVLEAMSGGDALVRETSRVALLTAPRNAPEAVGFRQAMLRDALRSPATVRRLYGLAGEADARRRKQWLGVFSRSPTGMLAEAAALMHMYLDMLARLRSIVTDAPAELTSAAWRGLAESVRVELDDGFFEAARRTLGEVRRGGGVHLSAGLGEGNAGRDYALRRASSRRPGWLAWALRRGPATFRLAPLDDDGARVLADMRNAAAAPPAALLAHAAEGVREIFGGLRTELAFYLGCLNLHERLMARAVPMTFPTVHEAGSRTLRFRGLVDAGLALRSPGRVVGNDLDLDGKRLIVISGANQGGKTVFLRSLGLAQVLAQAGLFVTAEAYEGAACNGLHTHFSREEDAGLVSGKLDEELARLSGIVDALEANGTLLLNESFAATNEGEGSEVARQVVSALVQRGVRVAFVTHLVAFAEQAHRAGGPATASLCPELLPGGTRTFRMVPARPGGSGHVEGLYRDILAEAVEGSAGSG